MQGEVSLNRVFAPSEDVVTRVIEGELLIVPITSAVGDEDDELFTFGETGRAIWEMLDGKRTLAEIVGRLEDEYQAAPGQIEQDVLGFAHELLRRRMIIAVTPR